MSQTNNSANDCVAETSRHDVRCYAFRGWSSSRDMIATVAVHQAMDRSFNTFLPHHPSGGKRGTTSLSFPNNNSVQTLAFVNAETQRNDALSAPNRPIKDLTAARFDDKYEAF